MTYKIPNKNNFIDEHARIRMYWMVNQKASSYMKYYRELTTISL